MLKQHRLLTLFFLAFLLRLSVVFIAHHGDLNNNISWATLAVERGLPGFYEEREWPYSAPNQPPLTILTFAGVRWFWLQVENISWWLNKNVPAFPSPFIWFWEDRGMVLLIKLPAILADLGIASIIYQYMKQKQRENLGLKLSIAWLFNPVSWYNSAVWGQTDAIVNFLGLFGIFYLLQKKLSKFTIFFTLSLLFKASLAIFVPILFLVALWQRYKIKEWMRALYVTVSVVIVTSIWFHPAIDFFVWLLELYKNRIFPGEIGYLTANAFNFWWLFGFEKTLDSTIYIGLPAGIWGFLLALSGMVGIIFWLERRVSDKAIFYSLALMSLLTFLFMTRIHERYLYPFFPVATILLGLFPYMIFPYIILSITHLLNLYHLFWAPSLAPLESLYKTPLFADALSLINVFVFFYVLRLSRRVKI